MRRPLLQPARKVLLSIASLVFAATAAYADPININLTTSMVIEDIGVDQGSLSATYGQSLLNTPLVTQATTTFGTVLNPAPSGVGTSMPLGQIGVPLPPVWSGYQWSPTTYDNTPFYLTVTVNSVNGDPHAANPSSFTVEGNLNGTLSINGPSSLTATFVRPDSVDPRFPEGTFGSFQYGGYDAFLAIPSGAVNDSSADGLVALTLNGIVVVEHATPEPTSFVVLGVLGLAQVGASRLRNRRRRGLAA